MVTAYTTAAQKITLGQPCLQGYWAKSAAPESVAQAGLDKRLSVRRRVCGTTEGQPANDADEASSSEDGLLASLLLDSFLGAVFGPLLPLWAQHVDWSNIIDCADEFWMDRRTAANDARNPLLEPVEMTYFPLWR